MVPSHLHELLSRFPLFRSTNFPHHSMPPPSLVPASPLFPLHFAAYTFFSSFFSNRSFQLPSFLIIFSHSCEVILLFRYVSICYRIRCSRRNGWIGVKYIYFFLEKNAVSLVLPSNNLSSSSIILFRMK